MRSPSISLQPSNREVASVMVSKKDFSLKKVVVKHKNQDTVIREGRKIGDGLWQVSFSANEIVEVEDEAGRSWGFGSICPYSIPVILYQNVH